MNGISLKMVILGGNPQLARATRRKYCTVGCVPGSMDDSTGPLEESEKRKEAFSKFLRVWQVVFAS